MALSYIARRAAATALICLLSLGSVAQANERLNPDEMRIAGFNALQSGHSKAALAVAGALLTRDANDISALVLKSRAARNLGHYDQALTAGRAAWVVADTDDEKFAAASAIAQALSSDGKRTRAQIWLRRAADVAPNDRTRAIAARDFQYVRARNPWSSELRFNIAPSDNINNGSARETVQLFGLPFEFQLSGAALPLEGVEYSAGLATRFRFSQGADFAHDLVFQVNHRTYTLGSDARARAPGVSGSDFEFAQAAMGYVYHRTPTGGIGPYSLNATIGQSWYGGDAYFGYLRLGGSQTVKLGKGSILSFTASGERQFGDRAPDADILRGDLRLGHRIGGLGTIGLSLGHSDSTSASDISDFTEWRSGVDLSLAKPVLGARVSFGLDLRQRDYPRSRYDPSGREDLEVSASVDMTFTQIERFGFNPTLSLHAARTHSNIGLYDSENLGVSFGLRSAF